MRRLSVVVLVGAILCSMAAVLSLSHLYTDNFSVPFLLASWGIVLLAAATSLKSASHRATADPSGGIWRALNGPRTKVVGYCLLGSALVWLYVGNNWYHVSRELWFWWVAYGFIALGFVVLALRGLVDGHHPRRSSGSANSNVG